MRERNKQNIQSSKSSFLQKFAGKLNVLTKDGEIKTQNSFKLPIINSPESKRANTIKIRPSKQSSSQSFYSEVRTEVSLSSIENSRSRHFFKRKVDQHLTDIQNHITKQPSTHNLKKSGIKLFQREPLTAIPFNKKPRPQKIEQHWRQPQSMETQMNKMNKMNRSYDYETFLNQLNTVSKNIKLKKGQSQGEG